jgi:muramoyltetrapeptide carboxypeptidase
MSNLAFRIYAPSGAVAGVAAIERAEARLAARGCRVERDPALLDRDLRFAGDDDMRVAAILRTAVAPGIDVALAARGGYGWSRLLDRLDFPALAASGKRWLGHSDFTAFQLAMLARAGAVTYAGPMAAYDFGAEEPSAYTLDHAFAMLEAGEGRAAFDADGPDLAVEGLLWGGNLAMLASLVGTPYLPEIEGGVLFVEDTGEHPYRVERMLWQLHLAGILGRQRALVVGAITDYALAPHDAGYDLDAALDRIRAATSTPIVTGLPFGHVRDKLTLPVGGRARLALRDGAATLDLWSHA